MGKVYSVDIHRFVRSGVCSQFAYLISLVFLMATPLIGQVRDYSEKEFNQVKGFFDRSYGSDYSLLNGRQYYLLYSSVSHPFIFSDQYRGESLRLNGVSYEGIPINYDIYKQHIVLQYTGYSGQLQQLILNQELIGDFSIAGKLFRRLIFPDTGARFYQVVSEGEVSCYLFWEKTMYYAPEENATPYNYTQPSRHLYILRSGQLHSIKTRNAFVNLFEEGYRKEINRFYRREKVSFKNGTDTSIRQLIEFCNNLLDTGE